MPIDIAKITPVEFCILVAWVRGYTTGKIHKTIASRFGKSDAAVRGIVNNKMSEKRADMTRERRQEVLIFLKDNRLDDGKMPDDMFVTMPLKTKSSVTVGPLSAYRKKLAKKPVPVQQDISAFSVKKRKKLERKILQEQKHQIDIEAQKREAREKGFAVLRGKCSTPLEYLDAKGLLDDPEAEKLRRKGSIQKISEESARFNAGKKMRELFAGSMLSGMKSQNFEAVGGGSGMGIAIPAKVLEYRSKIQAIKKMMTTEEFNQLESLLVFDVFVWMVPAKKGEAIILRDLRRALDTVGVFLDLVPEEAFTERWGYSAVIGEYKSRGQSRQEATAARDMIDQAQRRMK